ncbi:Abi family protein [Pectobacterium versatile]|uniref:Abi family protein n=1 Tax=Pectobacterium versatile TaxID=2488639 RepID=UPI003019B619
MNYQLNELKLLLSSPRIGTYERFFTGHTEQEVYGLYIWNKVLCGTIYPLLQAVEVSLRNTINNAAVKAYGAYWHLSIDHVPFNNSTDDFNYINLKNNFEEARRNWLKKENGKRKNSGHPLLPSNHMPDFNCIVAETEFSTWEFSLHRCFFKLNAHPEKFLWPGLLGDAFKNWPQQGANSTRDSIHRKVAELRLFRNRLSHHEPLWKGVGINREEDALIFINKKIDIIEELLSIISTDKVEFIRSKKLLKNARILASKKSLDIYRERCQNTTLSIRKKNKFKKFILSMNENTGPEIINLWGRKIIIGLA